MTQSCYIQRESQAALDACEVACCKIASLVAHAASWQCLLSHKVGDIGDIDFHRAGRGAQAVTSTGLVALIAILLDEGRQAIGIITRLTQVGNLALDDDALA